MNKLVILFVAVVLFVAQNSYFGWHPRAQSDAEMIVDAINLTIIAMGFIK
jgi:hypothetical protein